MATVTKPRSRSRLVRFTPRKPTKLPTVQVQFWTVQFYDNGEHIQAECGEDEIVFKTRSDAQEYCDVANDCFLEDCPDRAAAVVEHLVSVSVPRSIGKA